MAVKDDLINKIEYTDAWDGSTGEQVEDAITRAIQDNANKQIKSGEYKDQKLTLYREDGSSLNPIAITVIQPTYSYGIFIYGIKVNGTLVTRDSSEQIIQYNKDKKYEIGLAVYATADTTQRDNRTTALEVNLQYGSKELSTTVQNIAYEYFSFNDDNSVSGLSEEGQAAVKWISINDLFSSSQTSTTISATLVPDQTGTYTNLTDTFTTPITIQVISLTYTGSEYYTNGTQVTFTLKGGSATNYKLEGLNGSETLTASGMSVALNPGLNQLVVRAKHNTNGDIYTDWYYLDMICTSNCNSTAIAINKVSDAIPNNAIATLYDLTIYSPNRESVNIATYLTSSSPGTNPDPQLEDQLKTEIIGKDNYDSSTKIYNTTYYKYIENNNVNTEYRYLVVKVDDSFYQFNDIFDEVSPFEQDSYKYKVMQLSAVNSDYCYYNTGVTYNFDQINGRINNVFVTEDYAEAAGVVANVTDVEVSDGWQEDRGVLYYKISAQNNPILTLKDLNLGNEFSLEMKFKTYNVSDESQPILTFGNIQLLPTQLIYKGDTTKRNSIFRSEHIQHYLITVKKNFTISKDDPYYPDYMQDSDTYDGSFQKKFDEAMSSTDSTKNKFNLVRIFLNGTIDREYIIEDSEFEALKSASITINPTTSDVNFYLLRLYNQEALDFTQLRQNFTSSLMNDVTNANDNPKKEYFDKNDILDDNGRISFAKSYKKYNTIVMVFPHDPAHTGRTNYVPSRAWGGEDNADPHINDNLPTTLFIGYKDTAKNNKYGGRLTNTRVRGQGTSAMRYWIWNPATHITKAKKYVTDEDGTLNTSKTEKAKSTFTPYKNLDTKTNTFTAKNDVLKKYYIMPDEDDIKVTKAVGKVNYASSMQNHKYGTTNLYNSFYEYKYGTSKIGGIELGGKKAVKEEPFLYFYVVADDYDVSKWELADVLNADTRFMGFLTWGSGKGDEETFAIDSDRTPGYLFLEGGENGDPAVQFRVPWQALQRNTASWTDLDNAQAPVQSLAETPQISYEESLERPWDHLWISGDESIIYKKGTEGVTGAWDVNVGLEEIERGTGSSDFRLAVGQDDSPNKYLRESIKTWREFYDFVYTHDWDIVTSTNSDSSTWDTTKKVCCTANTCNVVINNGVHSVNDVYRYDIGMGDENGKWVRAGVKFDTEKNEWEAYNLLTATSTTSVDRALAKLRSEFTQIKYDATSSTSGPLDTNDATIHQALIRFVAGTDNRAKNTYFRIVGPVMTSSQKEVDGVPQVDENGDPVIEWNEPTDYTDNPRKYHYVGFLQDDVDTVLATDNNGLQTKEYNIIEPSYCAASETDMIGQWGENGQNVFFRCFDQAYETDITNMLGELIQHAFGSDLQVDSSSNIFYQDFFEMQASMFPAIAYNHTAKIYYELGQLVLNTGAISQFKSNQESPIQQSHGSCVESEMSFMEKRLKFLGTQAQKYTESTGELSINPGEGTGGSYSSINMYISYTTNQDFYPLLHTTGYSYIQNNGNTASFSSPSYTYASSTTRNYMAVAGTNYSTTINASSSVNNGLTLTDEYKTLEIKGFQGDNLSSANFKRLTDIKIDNNNRGSYPESKFSGSYVPDFPVAKTITFANMVLNDTLDFSSCTKLETLNLSGSTIQRVILPKSSHLVTVTLPKTITYFEIANAPNLGTVTLEGLSNLQVVDLNCDKVGAFDVDSFCEQLVNCNNLTSVTLTNANLTLSLDALNKLISVSADITGTITINEAISFDTKKNLMSMYGNIDNSSNKLYIKYISKTVSKISYTPELTIYGVGDKGNPFDINISGNDVDFISYNGKYIPNITYTSGTNISSVATLNEKTGEVVMLVDSSTLTTEITVTVTTKSNKLTATFKVSFTWTAPKLGDLVYADGTYTSSYISSKTLMGVVFAIDATSSTKGTAYIVGKEMLGSQYVGYSDGGNDSSTDSTLLNLYKVSTWLTEHNINNYNVVNGVTNSGSIIDSTINVTSYSLKSTSQFTGKSDTLAYVNYVNSTLLELLRTDDSFSSQGFDSLISNTNGTYRITSTDNLTKVLEKIPSTYGNESITEMQCLLYPYFYETYLYEPKVTDAEKATTAFQNNFSQGNWYVPSYWELANLIYYRGYSATGSDFKTGGDVTKTINTSLTAGSTDITTPIFSMACKNLVSTPTAWSNLANTNNLCSNTSSASYNYTYQPVTTWSGSSETVTYKWVPGYYSSSYYGEQAAATNGWRLKKHEPLPCVQFSYEKA